MFNYDNAMADEDSPVFLNAHLSSIEDEFIEPTRDSDFKSGLYTNQDDYGGIVANNDKIYRIIFEKVEYKGIDKVVKTFEYYAILESFEMIFSDFEDEELKSVTYYSTGKEFIKEMEGLV